jgi:4-alpha-glucanotransferase
LHDGFYSHRNKWKGAGVAIPVFSLRSKTGFGTGEFNDIKLLADWATQAGIKLIQLLPVNDTTSTFTAKDSYPYAAISAFALHPLYINLEEVAGSQNVSLMKKLQKKKKELDLLSYLDYESIVKSKLSCLREVYDACRNAFLKDKKFIDFFETNRDWLLPYAVYCYLRDKNKAGDFRKWKSHNTYNEKEIQKLASPSQPQYKEISFYYFIQYHLHRQLKEANTYAHKKGIVLKGDIAIGVSPNSCDVWMDPSLFNLNEQSGAPPDHFAVKGQNWGFPTYNWKKMQEDNFSWWRKRFAQMDHYFDSFRIDHILGFFRIWSIPAEQVEGIMGRFVPAMPVHISEFHQYRISFDHNRYCKPFITDEIINNAFGDKAAEIKKIFLDQPLDGRYQLKDEFDTQRKIENYFQQLPGEDPSLKEKLFDLASNVILFEDKSDEFNGVEAENFHFRISMQQTTSFKQLDYFTQNQLNHLYHDYFFHRQDMLWKQNALQKLPALKRSTNMLIFGEDLGMVPHCVPEVMNSTGILSLEVQRMPRDPVDFSHPRNSHYLSVVTPSTHDMSTIREWWEEDKALTQKFYNYILGHYGKAVDTCTPEMVKDIILQHIYSPAMWSIFQLQDLLGMNERLRRKNPAEERINQPADSDHYWKYRMHLTLEELLKQKEFTKELKDLMEASNRI